MKKVLFFIAALFVTMQSFAQVAPGTFTIQPTVGFNLSRSNSDKATLKPGFTAGVECGYKLNKLIAFTAGAMYSNEGWGITQGNDKTVLNYINIPILINFYVVKGLALKCGIQPGISLGGYMTDGSGSRISFSETASMIAPNSVNFSMPIGISYEVKNFTFDARYNVGVSPIMKIQGISDEKIANGMVFQLAVGYKIPLR